MSLDIGDEYKTRKTIFDAHIILLRIQIKMSKSCHLVSSLSLIFGSSKALP